jgi:membrane-associated phospholipid phosphatase
VSSLAASSRARGRALAAAREVGIVTLAALVYAAVRALTRGDLDEAEENGRRILHLERTLHIDWESAIQSATLAHQPLSTLANWIYIWGFWPVLAGSAVFLYTRHRDEYFRLRNAVFVSGLIGFAFFAFLPVAPPRLADPQLVDTITDRTGWYRTVLPEGVTDEYAAMPSLHVGWSLLVGIALARALGRRAYALALVIPAAMAFAVVATANHYVLDVVVGCGVALTALLVASRLPSWKRRVVRAQLPSR